MTISARTDKLLMENFVSGICIEGNIADMAESLSASFSSLGEKL